MMNFACLMLAAGAIFLPEINCGPFSERPDWADIKLRPVGRGTRGTGAPGAGKGGAISGYAAGAVRMHEERFVGDSQVRCSAYGHLFKLIDIYGANKDRPCATQITPETVIALNMVAYADRDEYNELLTKYRAHSLKRTFIQAIEELERMPEQTDVTRATWLELVDCASSIGLNSFVNVPIRARQIEQAKAASVDEGSDEPKKGRVEVSIFDQGGDFLYSDLEEARAKVEHFDDEVLRMLRLRLLRQRLSDEEIKKRITILKARKNWTREIRAAPNDNSKKLQIGVVSAWVQSWDELVRVKKYLDSIRDKSSKLVEEFVSNAENQQLADQMKATLENYRKVKNILAGIKLNKTYDSFKHLEEVYGPLKELSEQVGVLVYDKDLVEEVKKYNEYKAMNQFTEQSPESINVL